MPNNRDPLIYHREDEIAFIEINRPEKKNALNYDCWQLFDKYFDDLGSDNLIQSDGDNRATRKYLFGGS